MVNEIQVMSNMNLSMLKKSVIAAAFGVCNLNIDLKLYLFISLKIIPKYLRFGDLIEIYSIKLLEINNL